MGYTGMKIQFCKKNFVWFYQWDYTGKKSSSSSKTISTSRWLLNYKFMLNYTSTYNF